MLCTVPKKAFMCNICALSWLSFSPRKYNIHQEKAYKIISLGYILDVSSVLFENEYINNSNSMISDIIEERYQSNALFKV